MRHTVCAPAPGVPLTVEQVRIDGTARLRVRHTATGVLIGEFLSVEALAASGIDLLSLTPKEPRWSRSLGSAPATTK